jgi:periplasmic protein TonB
LSIGIVRQRKTESRFRQIAHGVWVVLGAVMLTLVFFLVLPLLQIIHQPPSTDLVVQSVDTALPPPPPPPPPEEPEKKPEPEEKPPELMEEAPPMNLSQLELALNPGDGAGLVGDFVNKLNPLTSSSEAVDALFSMADLDQKPRVLYQPGPVLNRQIRQQAPGTVYIIFIVDQRGRVENPIVQKSSDPVFERSALAAIKQWKFEPGKRNGQPVRFRMRVPITFPKG